MPPQKILPDEMAITSICLKCAHYHLIQGKCRADNPFAKKGAKHYLLLPDKSACYGFEKI